MTETLTLDQILEELHAAENDCQAFEKKYGLLSNDFYAAYTSGSITSCGSSDFALWAGSYKLKLSRLTMYRDAINRESPVLRNLTTLAETNNEAI